MSDLKLKYDWDLEDILKGKSIEDLYKKWLKKINDLIDNYDDQLKSIDNFINYKNLEQEYTKITNRLYNYISNNLNEDSTNKQWISWNQKLAFDIHPLLMKTSNEENIILKNKKKVKDFLKDDRLKEYRRGYELLFKKSKRILSEKEEMILTRLSKLSGSYEEIYSSVVDSTIKFDNVLDSKNKVYKITSTAKAFELLKSNDRTLRKNVWIEFNSKYYDNRYILTQTLFYNYLELNEYAKIRKYSNYIESVCDSDEVDLKFVSLIYKGVISYANEYKNFYSIRNKLISYTYGLNKLNPWDKSLDVVKVKNKYSIEEIQSTLLNAFKIFGNEYTSVLQKAFDERWISWLPKPNKHSGAYSIGGTKGLDKYYISMNYDSTISSLFTAAHELGHSLHSYFFNKSQKIHCSCSIFYAEIASITNELLLSYYLLDKSKNNKEKLFILDEIITNFFATTTRQVIFSNFEYEMIDRLTNNQPITCEVIFQSYNNLINKYTNSNKKVNINKKMDYIGLSTILRIDHFYVGNFYVYKYAIGQICALIISNKIWNNDKQALNNYFKFLKSGSSLSPLETIKLLDIDFNDNNIWNECKTILENLIKKYKMIAKLIMKK